MNKNETEPKPKPGVWRIQSTPERIKAVRVAAAESGMSVPRWIAVLIDRELKLKEGKP